MESRTLQKNLLELIRRTSAELPADVVRAIDKGWRREAAGSNAKYALKVVLDNIKLAKAKSLPICQDTGTIICYADLPSWLPRGDVHACLRSRRGEGDGRRLPAPELGRLAHRQELRQQSRAGQPGLSISRRRRAGP